MQRDPLIISHQVRLQSWHCHYLLFCSPCVTVVEADPIMDHNHLYIYILARVFLILVLLERVPYGSLVTSSCLIFFQEFKFLRICGQHSNLIYWEVTLLLVQSIDLRVKWEHLAF